MTGNCETSLSRIFCTASSSGVSGATHTMSVGPSSFFAMISPAVILTTTSSIWCSRIHSSLKTFER